MSGFDARWMGDWLDIIIAAGLASGMLVMQWAGLGGSPYLAIIMVPLLFFFSGHLVLLVIWPRSGGADGRRGITSLERIGISLGLSFAVIGVLNWTVAWRGVLFREHLITGYGLFFIFAIIAATTIRLMIPPVERFRPMPSSCPLMPLPLEGRQLQFMVLAVVALIASGTFLAYSISVYDAEEDYAEVYIRDLDGGTDDLPRTLMTWEEGAVVLAIECHGNSRGAYRILTTLTSGPGMDVPEENMTVRPWNETVHMNNGSGVYRDVSVAVGETWEGAFRFRVQAPGRYFMQWTVTNLDSEEVVAELHIWVEVN